MDLHDWWENFGAAVRTNKLPGGREAVADVDGRHHAAREVDSWLPPDHLSQSPIHKHNFAPAELRFLIRMERAR